MFTVFLSTVWFESAAIDTGLDTCIFFSIIFAVVLLRLKVFCCQSETKAFLNSLLLNISIAIDVIADCFVTKSAVIFHLFFTVRYIYATDYQNIKF